MKRRTVVLGVVCLGVAAVVMAYTSATAPTTTTKPAVQTTTSQKQVLPVSTGNPIVNTSQMAGLQIVSAIAENNTDATGKIINDHIEVSLKNVSGKDLTDFETYYTIKDATANVSESYYTKLAGFTLRTGETKAFHLDNGTAANHYPENKYSLYRTSKNAMQITIQVSTSNYKVAESTIQKDKGGAEKND